MGWDDDDIQLRAKRAVGRPTENPFKLPETEADFVVRGKAMLEKYHVPGGPNTRKDFVFGPGRDMSKTQFWAIVYIYYEHAKLINPNLQGFLNAVVRHLGVKYGCDRAGINRNVSMQKTLGVYYKHLEETNDQAKARQQRKYRKMYQYVVNLWESAVV